MADQLTAGPAIDAAACQALHDALMAAGKAGTAWAWKPESKLTWECPCGRRGSLSNFCPECGSTEACKKVDYEKFPDISTNGNVMLLALEHMRELGYIWSMSIDSADRKITMVTWRCREVSFRLTSDTAQEAVARAIVAALGGQAE